MNFLRPLIKLFGFLLVVFYGTDAVSQTTPIPDTNFEQDLIAQGYDTNGLNGNILNTDAAAITNYSTGRNDITDFTGLEAFVNLIVLNTRDNQYATINLNTLASLEVFSINNNQLIASLDLSQNPELRELNLSARSTAPIPTIATLDLSQNLKLETLNVRVFSSITDLILPETNSLSDIDIAQLSVPVIDMSLLTGSIDFRIVGSRVDVTIVYPNDPTVMKALVLSSINFPTVDVSALIALERFELSSTSTENFILPKTNTLTFIRIWTHEINVPIDLSIVPQLVSLDIRNNFGSTPLDINLRDNLELTSLLLPNNLMNSIDVTQNNKLNTLVVYTNNLTSLDVSHNPLITRLDAYNNQLPSIDLSQNPVLEYLNLSNNLIPTLDIGLNPELSSLNISNNKFTNSGLDLTQNIKLRSLDVSYNEIESLDITQNVNLSNLDISHNLFPGNDILNQFATIIENRGRLSGSLIATNNFLTGPIPDFYGLYDPNVQTRRFRLYIDQNNFHFGDFEEQHLGLVDLTNTQSIGPSPDVVIQNYFYSPQAKVNAVENLTLNAGEDIVLNTVVRGSQNHYKWFKDGVAIPDAPDSPNLVLDDLNSCDAGVYYSEITSDLVPFENSNPPGTNGKNLLLVRNDINLSVDYIKRCTQLLIPSQGDTEVAVNTPFQWGKVTGACGYKISAGTTAGASDIFDDVDAGNNDFLTLPENLPINKRIFVRITPYYEDGDLMGCSETSFTTNEKLTPPSCNYIQNPKAGDFDVDVTTGITWTQSKGALGYRLALGTTEGGTDILPVTDLGNVTSYQPITNLPYASIIYVSLTPYNEAGDVQSCQMKSFQTIKEPAPPSCPIQYFPFDGYTDVALNTSITWDSTINWGELSDYNGYRVSIGTSSGATDIADRVLVQYSTTYNHPIDFPANTTLYITVTAFNEEGESTGCREQNFKTTSSIPPICTALTNPLDGATNVSVNSVLSWNASATATGYFLSVGTTSGGSEILNNLDVGNVTSYDLTSDVPENTEIFVSIIPYNSAGNAPGCTEESFTTETVLAVPDCTTLVSPINAATDVPVNTTISWNAVSGPISGYYLSIGTTPGGDDIIPKSGVGMSTTYTAPIDFPYDTTIYVTVNPFNDAGQNTSCNAESFRTARNTIPDCTNLSSPLNGATAVSINTDLSWNAIADADGYFLTVGTTPGGTDLVFNQDLGNTTSFAFGSALPEDQNFYVVIVPYNEVGKAENCSEESFTTEAISTPPTCTSLITPADGATNVSLDTNLSWNVATGATEYFLTVGTTSGGSEILDQVSVTGTTYDLPDNLPDNTQIFVTITPSNTTGAATGCQEQFFTTQETPPIPSCTTLTNPGPGSTGAFITATISWERVEFANGYRISMGLDTQATSYVENRDIGNSDTFFLGEALPYDTDVYVKIVPYNSSGEAQGCMIQTFRTRPDPNTPDEFNCTQITSPQDGATDVATTTSLTWDAVPDAVSYLLTVGTTSGGSEIFNLLNVGSDTSFTFIDELEPNITYYVTVTPGYGSGSATDCPEIRFTTAQATGTVTKAPKSRYGISPDGDGINEFWKIEDLDQYPNNTVSIFNRWGDLVFETKDYDNSLNVFRGEANQKMEIGAGKLPEGTYFFMITSDNPELTEPVKGFIVLKR